ncbi:hypothetical protein P5673_008643 [Acropora cervicornis]|uniref:Uncharacterized protein n=1 Tax=Acropora cervicornis TaxID=6130 RepID=A0AAD9QTN5_ACRCE|nr:hypothetical protein P5673_008643 [Acropora cervicornis]
MEQFDKHIKCVSQEPDEELFAYWKYPNHGLPKEDSKSFRFKSFRSVTWTAAVNAFSADLSSCLSSLVLLDDGGVSEVSPPPIWPSVVEVVLSAQPTRPIQAELSIITNRMMEMIYGRWHHLLPRSVQGRQQIAVTNVVDRKFPEENAQWACHKSQ